MPDTSLAQTHPPRVTRRRSPRRDGLHRRSGEKKGAEKNAFRPSFKAVRCPPDVPPHIPDFRSCGFVTVPENRSRPGGGTVRLFVTHGAVERRSGSRSPADRRRRLGLQPYYDGIAPITERVNREVFILDARGVGHSRPSLSCPEVDSLRGSVPGVSTVTRARSPPS